MDYKYIEKVIFFIVLLFVLFFLLIWSNVINCGVVPGMCSVYWGIMGPPKVLVASSYDGMGNPNKLVAVLEDKDMLGLRVYQANIDDLTPSRLNKYTMVFVTKARTISTEKLAMFADYANSGGRLIWTGDAGTEGVEDNASSLQKDTNISYSGWVRALPGGGILNFEKVISASYVGNYYQIANNYKQNTMAGLLVPNPDGMISKGLINNAYLYGDFALVKPVLNTMMSIDMQVDLMSKIVSKDKDLKEGQKKYPVLILSGFGNKIVYSAVPIENYVKEDGYENTGMFYTLLITNLYDNLIGR